jgi:toxoflavin biosynthesis protein ToxD
MKKAWILIWMAAGVATACFAGDWTEIPVSSAGSQASGGFEMGTHEVTVSEFVRFLNQSGTAYLESAQIEPRRKGRVAATHGTARQAVAEVSFADAQAYAQWVSNRSGRVVRLPTEAEWEAAARGGIDGAPFPWGWGGVGSELAQFDASAPARHGGRFPANGFGLVDMAGNVYEWCEAAESLPAAHRIARGGSWAERDPAVLKVDHRHPFEETYRGRDVGFRVLREREKE